MFLGFYDQLKDINQLVKMQKSYYNTAVLCQ